MIRFPPRSRLPIVERAEIADHVLFGDHEGSTIEAGRLDSGWCSRFHPTDAPVNATLEFPVARLDEAPQGRYRIVRGIAEAGRLVALEARRTH